MFKRIALLLAVLCGFSQSMPSRADTIVTWTIENANFDNGSLSGSFTLDYVSPTLPLVTGVNVTSTGTPGSFFYPSNLYSSNPNDFYALVPLHNNVDCSGPLPAVSCPYVQLYGVNQNQTGVTTVTLLNLVFPTNLSTAGGIVPLLMSHDIPLDGSGAPTGASCVGVIQCTSEEAFSGPSESIPPTGTPTEYRGLLDPPTGPYLVGVVQPVPLPAGLWLFGSGCALLFQLRRRKSTV